MCQGDIVVLGSGGHARVVIQCLQSLGLRVRGYAAPRDRGALRGVPYLGKDHEVREGMSATGGAVALGLGKVCLDSPRLALVETFLAYGLVFPPIVAAHAVVHDDVVIGSGSVVLDGTVVVTGTKMGRACIVNTHATVDHDCELGSDVHVAPGATLSGGVRIGDNCLIGTGANVIQGISITANCLVGAGATVVWDLDMPGTYMGTPARRIG